MADERKTDGDLPLEEENRAGSSSQVDRIRDIIIGDKVQALEDRLIRVDRSLDREVEALRDEVRRLRSDLTGLIQGEVNSVKEDFRENKTRTEQTVITKVEELDTHLQSWLSAKVVAIENNVTARQEDIQAFRESAREKMNNLGQRLETLRREQQALGGKLADVENILSGVRQRNAELSEDTAGLKNLAVAQAGRMDKVDADITTLQNGLKETGAGLAKGLEKVRDGLINGLAEAKTGLEARLEEGLAGIKTGMEAQAGELAELGRVQSGLLDSLEDLADKHLAGLAEMRQRMVRHLVFYHPSNQAEHQPGRGAGGQKPPRPVKASLEAEDKESEK